MHRKGKRLILDREVSGDHRGRSNFPRYPNPFQFESLGVYAHGRMRCMRTAMINALKCKSLGIIRDSDHIKIGAASVQDRDPPTPRGFTPAHRPFGGFYLDGLKFWDHPGVLSCGLREWIWMAEAPTDFVQPGYINHGLDWYAEREASKGDPRVCELAEMIEVDQYNVAAIYNRNLDQQKSGKPLDIPGAEAAIHEVDGIIISIHRAMVRNLPDLLAKADIYKLEKGDLPGADKDIDRALARLDKEEGFAITRDNRMEKHWSEPAHARETIYSITLRALEENKSQAPTQDQIRKQNDDMDRSVSDAKPTGGGQAQSGTSGAEAGDTASKDAE
jgi:hypothetical protein